MSAERYPADLVLMKQDFVDCGWEAVLSSSAREDYSSMWQAFSSAARQAMEEGRQSHGKALWLLADACSMRLLPKSSNDPFKPMVMMPGSRSAIPDDFSEADIDFFSEAVGLVSDPLLKARLADLIWIKGRPRDVRFALMAIDAYRVIPLNTETWIRYGRECWERAISLAITLRAGAGDRLKEMEVAIFATFEGYSEDDGYLALWLADLLESNRLGHVHRADVAQKLEVLACVFDGNGDLHRARDYFRVASDWFKASGNVSKAAEMTVALAEGWVKEAVSRISSQNPSHMVAASFYENAIQVYRTIPRSERAVHRVDERIAELRKHLAESGEISLGEMGVISTPSVDISKMIENAKNAVRGKNPIDALKAFVNLHQSPRVKVTREDAIESIRKHPIQHLFPVTVMSRDGRVIAKRPGMSLGEDASAENESVIRAGMIRDYSILLSITVQGGILPALEILLLEHRLCESDFIGLSHQSPIVPTGRERLFGKALFAGYDRDIVAAIHILIPQIEHMVRFHLKQAGAKTTTLDQNGIENEIGLSALMELPEAQRVFGEDLCFELEALLCDALGPNLRNELAHGLLDDDGCQSAYAIYLWWLGLKLVFIAFWNKARMGVEGGDSGEET